MPLDIWPPNAGRITQPGDSSYEEDKEIELQAQANDAYVFTHWSGDIDSTASNSLSLTVDQGYALDVYFKKKTYDLTTSTEGEGSVSEHKLEQKSKECEHGTVVELTANPSEGSKFVEWKGTDNPTLITVKDTKEVTVVFKKKSYALTINTTGNGSVTKTLDQQEYAYNSTVHLEATPATGYRFIK